MPHTPQYEALDCSPTETLASIRLVVLSYLADLETCVSEADAPWKGKGEMTVEELRQWSHTTLEMLETIRDDVCSHLPDFSSIGDVHTVEDFVREHLPDMPRLDDFSSKLPDMPHLPDFTAAFHAKLDEVCATFQTIDIPSPLSYVPQLSEHLKDLQLHLADIEIPSSPWSGPSAMLSDMLDSLMQSEVIQEILNATELDEPEESEADILEVAAGQAAHIAHAVKRSLEGSKLISFGKA